MDILIARVKEITTENRSNQQRFAEIGQPHQSIITRWSCWLSAALYYSKNLPKVKEIIDSIDGEESILCEKYVSLASP